MQLMWQCRRKLLRWSWGWRWMVLKILWLNGVHPASLFAEASHEPLHVYFIRHGEKPADPIANLHLSVKGQERAMALVPFFLPGFREKGKLKIQRPSMVVAQVASTLFPSERSHDTAIPIAAALGIPVRPFHRLEEPKVARYLYEQVVAADRNDTNLSVLVIWEHQALPVLVQHLINHLMAHAFCEDAKKTAKEAAKGRAALCSPNATRFKDVPPPLQSHPPPPATFFDSFAPAWAAGSNVTAVSVRSLRGDGDGGGGGGGGGRHYCIPDWHDDRFDLLWDLRLSKVKLKDGRPPPHPQGGGGEADDDDSRWKDLGDGGDGEADTETDSEAGEGAGASGGDGGSEESDESGLWLRVSLGAYCQHLLADDAKCKPKLHWQHICPLTTTEGGWG
ncbi:unnamed protein product [Vitrella brassicaformis CCMP3155]|uniref:Uncharacterized protein n=1 Tax=Vitrella brassicaformis (strain CCMP3155) TaxID=1169540 RepID=A0A0G4EGD9_VITBC|nr:unnamed protein product [Vitrella brassicaformis CCMP3155]|eukprot:CEL94535.1 unnamed protein product [Vitrella brassicaformis CCMP3155]